MNRKKQPTTNKACKSSSKDDPLLHSEHQESRNQIVSPSSFIEAPLHMKPESKTNQISHDIILRKPPPTASEHLIRNSLKSCSITRSTESANDSDSNDNSSLLTNKSLSNLQHHSSEGSTTASSSSSSQHQQQSEWKGNISSSSFATTQNTKRSSSTSSSSSSNGRNNNNNNMKTKDNDHMNQPHSSTFQSSPPSDERKSTYKQQPSKTVSSQVDAGYAGSASSNDGEENDGNNSSTSDSSCAAAPNDGQKIASTKGRTSKTNEQRRGLKGCLNEKKKSSHCLPSSSDLADFSSTDSELYSSDEEDRTENALAKLSNAVTLSLQPTSKTSGNSKRSRDSNVSPPRSTTSKTRRISSDCTPSSEPQRITLPRSWDFIERSIRKKSSSFHVQNVQNTQLNEHTKALNKNYQLALDGHSMGDLSDISSTKAALSKTQPKQDNIAQYKSEYTPINEIGADVMAKVLSYLCPSEIIKVLSSPLSKRFRESFTVPQDVWKILCLSDPFYAHSGEEVISKSSTIGKSVCDVSSSANTTTTTTKANNGDLKVLYSKYKYRLMYASFARCMIYLDRIKYDIKKDKESKLQNYIGGSQYSSNSSLRRFFERVRGMQNTDQDAGAVQSTGDNVLLEATEEQNVETVQSTEENVSLESSKNSGDEKVNYQQIEIELTRNDNKPKYGASSISNRLLGPVHEAGIAGDLYLPLSCAVYSIVNWMVAFADVAGIQVMCMNVLPMLLEDDHQRTTAQKNGLTDIVLRAMVIFPNNAELHTSAFHTLVLLARPIGGREGTIFYRAMVNASAIFNVGSSTGKSGIAIMMDSVRRFASNERLQAMSCWSMVNVALNQSQKKALVRLGGIAAAGNAMMLHPLSEEVQFRALFALINLVSPLENSTEDNTLNGETGQNQEEGVEQSTHRNEIEMLENSLECITDLVVVAMRKFRWNQAIVNRGCLVIHNLSLNTRYHGVLLFTPHCYRILEWCVVTYTHDKVLQESAMGTLQRLQATLSNNQSLQSEFNEMIRKEESDNRYN